MSMTPAQVALIESNIRHLTVVAYESSDEDEAAEALELLDALRAALHAPDARPVGDWQPIETAPPGLANGKWTYVLFSGYSKGGSFAGRVVVSGWMGKTHEGTYQPVHNYSYKLVITHWAPHPGDPAPPAQPGGTLGTPASTPDTGGGSLGKVGE